MSKLWISPTAVAEWGTVAKAIGAAASSASCASIGGDLLSGIDARSEVSV